VFQAQITTDFYGYGGKQQNLKVATSCKRWDIRRWTGLVNYMVDWSSDGIKIKEFILERYPYLGQNYEIKIRPYTFGTYGWTYSSMSQDVLVSGY